MPPRRGEVWTVRFDPAEGAEMRKVRPAVVVNTPQVGRLPLCIVVPITNWRVEYGGLSWFVRLASSSENGLSKESGADAFQVKSVSVTRFIQKLGELAPNELAAIADAIAFCVGYQFDNA